MMQCNFIIEYCDELNEMQTKRQFELNFNLFQSISLGTKKIVVIQFFISFTSFRFHIYAVCRYYKKNQSLIITIKLFLFSLLFKY